MGIWRQFKDMPVSVKVIGCLLALIFIMAVCVVAVIPLAILLIAFPKLWILIGVGTMLLTIGYIKGRQ